MRRLFEESTLKLLFFTFSSQKPCPFNVISDLLQKFAQSKNVTGANQNCCYK